jgi:aminoglycoside phosphotransferase (APT) family kinase protein
MWALNDAKPPTLVHGDCHGGNLFYAADGAPGFLDWQCTFPGTPRHDLGELLLTTQNIMHNMVSSVLNPYDMQTAEVTTITAGRTLHAAHDLDLLGALAE